MVEIYRVGSDHDVEDVVKWCTNCGAVVIDGEYDNRTAPGKVMKMRFPTREKQTYGKILAQFVGMSPSDLTAAEKKVLDIVSEAAGVIMPADEFGQMSRPVSKE